MKTLFAVVCIALMSSATSVYAGPVKSAKEAVDPDCTPAKAAKRAASKATVGVAVNRCDAGETARDTAGVDGKKPKKAAKDAAKDIRK